MDPVVLPMVPLREQACWDAPSKLISPGCTTVSSSGFTSYDGVRFDLLQILTLAVVPTEGRAHAKSQGHVELASWSTEQIPASLEHTVRGQVEGGVGERVQALWTYLCIYLNLFGINFIVWLCHEKLKWTSYLVFLNECDRPSVRNRLVEGIISWRER